MLGQIAGFKPFLLEGSSACTAVPGTRAHTKCSNTDKTKPQLMEPVGFLHAGFKGR